MQEFRPLIHEILNALAIARGLSEGVQASLKGELDALTPAEQLDKINRIIKAMDRIEKATMDVRGLVQAKLND